MNDGNDLVMIQLDRPRVLRFGHKAIKTLGALTGKDIDSAMKMDELDLDMVEKIFYCGLLHDAKENGETLRLEDMEDLLDQAPTFMELIEKMQLAFDKSFGPQVQPGEQPGNLPTNRAQRRATGKKA